MKDSIKRVFLVGATLILLTAVAACGGGGGGGSITITVTPATVTVAKGATQQFAASNGSSDITSSVTWSASSGEFSTATAGLYTPPAILPADNVITVTATQGSDSGTAAVTLTVGGAISFTDKSFYTVSGDVGFASDTQAVAYDETNHIIYTAFTDLNIGSGLSVLNYVYKSSDAGASFSAPAGDLTPEGCLMVLPQLVLDGNAALNIVLQCAPDPWTEQGLFSEDGGATFGAVTVAAVEDATKYEFPAIIADSANNIYLMQIVDFAATNSVEANLQKKTAGASEFISIGEMGHYEGVAEGHVFGRSSMAVDQNGYLYIAYAQKNELDNNRVSHLIKYPITSGGTPSDIILSGGSDKHINPQVVIDSGGTIHYIVPIFDDSDAMTGPIIIGYVKSSDGGATWSEPAMIAETNDFTLDSYGQLPGYAFSATVDGLDNLIAAYADTDGIYFVRSTDGGATWSAKQQIVGDILGSMRWPMVTPMISVDADSAGRVYLMSPTATALDAPFIQYFGIGE